MLGKRFVIFPRRVLYQVTAMQLGEITFLTAEEGASAARNIEPQMMPQ